MINQMRSRSIRSNLSQNKDEKESEKYVEKAWRERVEKEQSERKSGERECVVVQRYVRIEKLKKDGNREREKNSFPTGSRNIFVQINGKASSKHWHNIKFTSLLQQLYLFFFLAAWILQVGNNMDFFSQCKIFFRRQPSQKCELETFN